MNICLITGIFPPDIGGPATYVSRLARVLHDKGHKINVVTLGDEPSVFPYSVQRISRKRSLIVRLLKLFLTLLREGRTADVWYINGLELPAVLAGKLLRKRLVMKIVGDYAWERAMNDGLTSDSIDDFQKNPQQWRVELHKTLRAWLARQVERVITPSCYLKELVMGWGVPDERVCVIYNAVETLPETFPSKEESRKKFGFAEHSRVMITVGRLVKWKGIDSLIRVLAELDESICLLILGDGPEKNVLTEVAENLRVAHRVIFGGKAAREDALAAMRAADLFVLNTGYEGFSHVLLEAMQVGTPVITTNVCGNPELVSHESNGLLFEVNNTDDLRTQILRLLEQPSLRDRYVEAGYETTKRFTWEKLLQRTCPVVLSR